MDGWTIMFSPGGINCTAMWNNTPGANTDSMSPCNTHIPAGYIVASHGDFPGERMCLRCMVATVRACMREMALDGAT
jgi:hypothetical protein